VQERLNEALAHLVRDDAFRHRCAKNGIAFGRMADVYQMAERAVDLIETRIRG